MMSPFRNTIAVFLMVSHPTKTIHHQQHVKAPGTLSFLVKSMLLDGAIDRYFS